MKKTALTVSALLLSAMLFSQNTPSDPPLRLDSLNKIIIKPVQLSVLDAASATSMKIVSIMDDLTTTAEFYITLYDEKNRKIGEKNMKVSGAEYAGWDRKLPYIARLFCKKYNVQLQ